MNKDKVENSFVLPPNASMSINRPRLIFHCLIVAFILFSAFVYGLVKGSRKQAFASRTTIQDLSDLNENIPQIRLPAGVVPVPMGENTKINGGPVQMVAFFSDRSIIELSKEQLEVWKENGMQVIEKVTERRGVVVAIDPVTAEKFNLVIWEVPPQLRQIVSNGYSVQGIVSRAGKSEYRLNSANNGEVPGIPIPPGGKGGSVFSSLDQPQANRPTRSYSAIYTSPSDPSSVAGFYRQELSGRGWMQKADEELSVKPGKMPLGYGQQLMFVRGEEEITLLIGQLPIAQRNTLDNDIQTLVTVILTGIESLES